MNRDYMDVMLLGGKQDEPGLHGCNASGRYRMNRDYMDVMLLGGTG